jgi:hypothetical protein
MLEQVSMLKQIIGSTDIYTFEYNHSWFTISFLPSKSEYAKNCCYIWVIFVVQLQSKTQAPFENRTVQCPVFEW